ncbi:unnamed protein product [Darwinula stevensoni]|uniref:Phosducin domain-containing protein n=1 Tax=Darwinula stevensoni TaxID=69355 RepID=A0A7R9A0Q3_9CRUS|nr:unnamed protein product [Darwinula stevensoni]CAG0885031.1 unnamed protein product [Darwinula stevensoni]
MSEDTEWNDILRAKGIIPPKPKEKEVTEEDLVQLVETTIQQKSKGNEKKAPEEMTMEELEEALEEDEESERAFLAYRAQRVAELKELTQRNKFGEVKEISAVDYVDEVNKAGEGIWVILHLYRQGIPECALINQHLAVLAQKFPETKFLKSIASTCIPNYPDKNLPTLFIYFEGQMKKKFIGPDQLHGTKLTIDELEWMLGKVGAVKTEIEEDPRPKIKDALSQALGANLQGASSDEDDW